MSDNENILFEVQPVSDFEESEASSEEETAPEVEEPEPVPEGTEPEPVPEPEPSKIQRTKTGRIKKKASPRTKERLRNQLAKGRAKSLEIRRRNKKLKEVSKRKKIDAEDEILLKELQERKSNQELQEEINLLRNQLKNGKVPEKELKLPPKPAPEPRGNKPSAPAPITAQPVKNIKSLLPGGFTLSELRGL
tara:strand:+ start:301 stop:876 length:576 start_codon:yes stop_codon:yes gene_type:complete